MIRLPNAKQGMTPERFQEIRAFFEVVLPRNAIERASVLSDARERDPELAREVEALIAAYERNASFIDTPLARLNAGRVEAAPSRLKGTWIGAYELGDMIGEGGMGQVWRAEQRTPIQRTVALKLIKAGMDTHEVIRRFESERQAVALMEHPAIAKVFEAGTTPLGRPYFAMEYVVGVPITTYCDQHRLTNRERLQLFIRVCEGIQHAHQKGDHTSGYQAIECVGHGSRWQAIPQDHRFWSGTGNLDGGLGRDRVYAARDNIGDAGLHESGTSIEQRD